jgi:membrane protein
VVRSFVAHRGLNRAASLSYTSLLALVPLIALVLSISKAVLRDQDTEILRLVDHVLSWVLPQLQVLSAEAAASAREDVFARIQQSIERIHAGALGAFGAVTLVGVGISLLSAVETAMNDVWGVPRGRTFAQRVVYYWAGVTLGPILLLFAIGFTTSGIVARALGTLPGPISVLLLQFLLPFVILGLGFTLLYWAIPNTTVPLRAAALGGLTAGTLFQVNNLLSALYFSQVVYYSRIYGSLGAIPVVMIGLFLSWSIVLVGAEVAYVAATPAPESPPLPDTFTARSRIALDVARIASQGFLEGRGGASVAEVAEALDIPLEWVNRTVAALCDDGLFVCSTNTEHDRDGAPRYLPSRPPRDLTALEIVRAVRGDDDAEVPPASASVREILSRLDSAEQTTLGATTLEDLVDSGRTGRS